MRGTLDKPLARASLLSVLILLPALAAAQTHDGAGAHADPVTPVVLALAIILAAAKLGGHLAARMGQPAVLGELVTGVVLGSLDLMGIGWFHRIEADPGVDVLARLGVVILLFEVGLESTVRDMLKVGLPSVLVILEDVPFRPFAHHGDQQLEHLVHPISTFLVPVFFVIMGMRVDLSAFARTDVLGLAAVLTLAAIVAKQVCSLGAIDRSPDRLSIGIGMIPRGEVGLIFANIGLGLTLTGQPIVDDGIFSAVVIMVIVTTMATPPLLKWSLARR